MTDPRITDEMVEVAARAIEAILWPNCREPYVGGGKSEHLARAALSAAIPLIDRWIKIDGEPDTSKAPWDGEFVWAADARAEQQYEMWWTGECFETDFDDAPTPTHWMPLPPAPKGDE